MARAAAIIIQDGALALIKRTRPGRLYYLFPGGQVEPQEANEDTVRREVKEELGFDVEVGRLIAEVVFEQKSQFFYLADVTGGTFGTGDGAEMLGKVSAMQGTYEPVWIPISELTNHNIVPNEVVQLVQAVQGANWPTDVLMVDEK